MPQATDLEVVLSLDGDAIPLRCSTTIGRQLDNDLVVAGEDVLDFHLRVEPTDRGARAFPLGEASLIVNGQDWDEPVDLAVGDVLTVGVSELRLDANGLGPAQADEWWLHADRDVSIYKVNGRLAIGRSEDNEILLLDDHISRKHAELFQHDGVVWLRDFRSANGTFVNGRRLVGGCRLFHGDEVSFDALRFQLVGKGQDLTPVRQPASITQVELIREAPAGAFETTEFSLLESRADTDLVIPSSSETGAFLLGISDPIRGYTFRTGIGTSVIGRDDDCDVVIRDPTVSARHAEINVRPETTTVTNLMATNGTRVNGQQIQSAELADGDVLRIGGVSLVFKDVPAQQAEHFLRGKLHWLLLGSSVLLAIVLIWLL